MSSSRASYKSSLSFARAIIHAILEIDPFHSVIMDKVAFDSSSFLPFMQDAPMKLTSVLFARRNELGLELEQRSEGLLRRTRHRFFYESGVYGLKCCARLSSLYFPSSTCSIVGNLVLYGTYY
jgi:hypothetical protein